MHGVFYLAIAVAVCGAPASTQKIDVISQLVTQLQNTLASERCPYQLSQTTELLRQVKSNVDQVSKTLETKLQCQMMTHHLSHLQNDKANYFSTMGSIFHFNLTYIAWNQTQEYCKQRGMRISFLKTANEVQLVTQQIKLRAADANKYGYWLSATNIGQASPQQFQWTDGTPLNNSDWASGRPSLSIGGKEACVHFNTLDAKYRDWKCTDGACVLCVVPVTQCACA